MGVLAQVADPAGGGPAWWATALVAFFAALLGGVASTLGSRWSTAKDLQERNRHALLMEDVKAYLAARTRGVDQMLGLDPLVTQIKTRTLLLSPVEVEAGRQLGRMRDVALGATHPNLGALDDAVLVVRIVAVAHLDSAADRRTLLWRRPWRRKPPDPLQIANRPGGVGQA